MSGIPARELFRTDAAFEPILRLVEVASRRVMEIYHSGFEVEMKGPNDPVTQADKEANVILTEGLAAAFPDAGIVAEESVPSPDVLEVLIAKKEVFFVDPVDGTREFADKNGEFAVMVGLSVDGRASLGVVSIPVKNQVLVGRFGVGAWLMESFMEKPLDSLVALPLSVTEQANPAQARAVVSRSHKSPRLVPIFETLGITSEIQVGSVGLKVAKVVTGAADLYVHPSGGAKKWDSCGPSAILIAAGGRFTNLLGEEIEYAERGLDLSMGIAATNGALHDAVIGASRAVMARPAAPIQGSSR